MLYLFGSGYFIVPSVGYGISSKSESWELIKEFLDREDNDYIASISAKRDRFNKSLKDFNKQENSGMGYNMQIDGIMSSLPWKKRT